MPILFQILNTLHLSKDIGGGTPVLVRMHALDLMADLLGEVSEKRAGNELASAMQMIANVGQGVVVVLREALPAV